MSDELIWLQPIKARTYHIFDEGRSLCGNWMMLRWNDDEVVDVDSDTYTKGQDCKACCRKAGLIE